MDLVGPKASAALLYPYENLPGDLLRGSNCTIAGWGKTERNGQSPVILSAPIDIISTLTGCTCSKNRVYRKLASRKIQENTQFCAGIVKGTDTCVGDSGGPLFCEVNQQQVLVGLTSFGSPNCGNYAGNEPGVYVNIAHFLKWIKRYVLGKPFLPFLPFFTTFIKIFKSCRQQPVSFNGLYTICTGFFKYMFLTIKFKAQ